MYAFRLKKLGLDEGISSRDLKNQIPYENYTYIHSEVYRSESRSKYKDIVFHTKEAVRNVDPEILDLFSCFLHVHLISFINLTQF